MPDPSEGLEGRVVGGDFEVVRLLATGGMAAVYEAVQRSTGRARAIKVMHGWLLRDPAMRARFVEEARVASSIESDHVVEVVSAGIDDALGAPWIAMELLRGETLTDHAERKGALSPAECLEVLSQARHGLELAHERGIVHRDLKPDNLFVAAARRPGVPFTIKVLDFGIAKWIGEVRGGMKNSQAMGTPSWMAPEQLALGKAIAPATDVWALGLLAFWMLAGKEYWIAANEEAGSVSSLLLELVTTTSPEAASARAARIGAMSTLPPGFDAWFGRCVHPDPARRFGDAASCVDALRPVLDPASPSASVTQTNELVAPNPADDDLSWWVGHATACLTEHGDDPALLRWLDGRTKPRPTALPIGPDGVSARLWAGPPEHAALGRLFELLSAPLVAASWSGALAHRDQFNAKGHAPPSPPSGGATAAQVPFRVRDAVRHAALILAFPGKVSVVAAEGDDVALQVDPAAPGVLRASAALCAETSPFALRARAAIALTRSLAPLPLAFALGSPEELEQARRAAHALARGTISQSRYFRPLASAMGSRRAELAEALDAARAVTTEAWWTAAELTLARAALLVAADLPSVLSAMAALPPRTPAEAIEKSLFDFVHEPSFEGLWHQPSRSS
jgi:serine/threonine-protein kinase